MSKASRIKENPILTPRPKVSWESEAVFNASPIKENDTYHLVYRAMSSSQIYYGSNIELSAIGYAKSSDGIKYKDRRRFIFPEHEWEKYGCEDPRVTKLGDKYYIFYTALSDFPHTADGIKVGVAITPDFKKISEKHLVTHFNSKATALFPEKIDGKYTLIVTANTDKPPSQIAIAQFKKEEHMWSQKHWGNWLSSIDDYELDLLKDDNDHVEIGAAPIKTSEGWLLIYSYIKNYKNPPPIFGIEAVLLDLNEPTQILARSTEPLLIPEKDYELHGKVPNIVFPSGALVEGDNLNIYYGAADTSICIAKVKLKELLNKMLSKGKEKVKLRRFKGNPIISPIPGSDWESKFTLNPAAVYLEGKVHIVYRAMNDEKKSSLGYASSKNGLHIDERLGEPIYSSREDTRRKIHPMYHSCEDPRITQLEDRLYMCYTAYDGKTPTVVALTSIKKDNFLNKRWKWTTPRIISDPVRSDKNTCIFPEKIKGKYAFLHRLEHKIWIDYLDDLEYRDKGWLAGKPIMLPREHKWDSEKIGIAGPPIKTDVGWLLIFHGLSKFDRKYRLGVALLDLKKPENIISRLDYPILEPEEQYEMEGDRPGTVFACGSVVIDGKIYVYYGAADQVVAVAYCRLKDMLRELLSCNIKSN